MSCDGNENDSSMIPQSTPAPSRRDFAAGVGGLLAAVRGHAQDRKPNLLFLIADDHAGYVLGADGNRLALTPNLDRLAAQGTRFAANYCNSPVCTPSRQSVLTGLLPHAAGVTTLRTPLDKQRQTIAHALRASGYHTAVFGKMHWNQPGVDGLHGFDQVVTEDVVQRRWLDAVGPVKPIDGVRTKPVWRPFRDPARVWLNAEKLPFPRREEEMRSTWVTEQAGRYLDEHKDSPFALWVSLQEPHSPFDFPVDDRDRFASSRYPVPRVGPEDREQIPLIFRDLTAPEKQGIISAYYTSVHFLDRNWGRLLHKLDQLNLTQDTIVVYMADHGYSLGQHGRFEKHCSYEPALRVPLILRWPGKIKARQTVRQYTESVDVPATILDLLGASRLERMHGQTLRPYLEGNAPQSSRTSIFSEYLENEETCVRTARWKLVHCSGRRKRQDGYETDNPTPGRTVRLFDLKSDPGEFRNVAPKHPEVTAELTRVMLERFRQTHPEASAEPQGVPSADALEWYLRPRDVQPNAAP